MPEESTTSSVGATGPAAIACSLPGTSMDRTGQCANRDQRAQEAAGEFRAPAFAI